MTAQGFAGTQGRVLGTMGVLILLLLVRWRESDWVWRQVGMVQLAHALAAEDEQLALRAEAMLRRLDKAAPARGWGLGLSARLRGDEAALLAAWQEADPYVYYGQLAHEDGDYEMALRWYGWASHLDDGWGDPWYFASLSHEALAERGLAIAALQKAETAVYLTEVGESDISTLLGQQYLMLAEGEKAILYFEQALAEDRFIYAFNRIRALDGLGALYLQARAYDSAVTVLEEAVALETNYHWPYLRLGWAYYRCCGEVETAVALVEESLRLNRSNKWAYKTLGDIYREEGDVMTARRMYECALTLDPQWQAVIALLEALS